MAGKLMQAVRYDRYGGGAAALKHVEVPVPTPSKDEVLIKVEACSLNPIDWKVQKGALRPFLPPKFPHVPATDVAGDVVEVGDGVTKFKVGDKVISKLPTGGGLAEFAVAKENLTVPKPSQLSAVEGASIPLAGLAAHEALTSAGVKLDGSGPRLNVLITAASGGVGHYAVQLAKLGNTYVTATCGARNIEFVRGLGADEVLDYKTPEGAALKSSSGQKYDVVIHGAAPIPWSQFKSHLSSKGKVVDLNPGLGTMLTSTVGKLTCSSKRLIPLLTSPKGENLDYLVKLARDGKLKPQIDSTYPLAKAEDAWSKCIDGHATGKIVVEV